MSARTIAKAWIFDVDGVITNPKEKRVTEPKLFEQWIQLLKTGDILALNTGRSLTWINDRIVLSLTRTLEETSLPLSLLEHFFIIGEKGAVWMENGKVRIDNSLQISLELQEKVRNLIEEEFANTMFFDTTKQTMISTEMIDRTDISLYHQEQQKLVKKLYSLLTANQKEIIKIDPTTIATDIENKTVGKALGMQRLLSILATYKLNLQHFYLFGDSVSDLEMGEELAKQQLPFTFVYVGLPEKLPPHLSFPVVQTQERFDKGTVAFLKSLENIRF